jgi:hypothetical protein
MSSRLFAAIAVSLLVLAAQFALIDSAHAQQIIVGTPFQTIGHSYYEHIGTRWGISGPGWFFNFGGPGPAPAFGGFDPGAQANFGFGFGGGGVNGFFNATAGQGSDRSFVSSTPSVTIMNGGQGFFSDTVQRPFVTGLIPVVGSAPGAGIGALPGPVLGPNVLEERLQRLAAEGPGPAANGEPAPALVFPPAASTAERGDESVAAIKARREAERSSKESAAEQEVAALLEKARGAEADGKPSVAKIYLQMAARRATGDTLNEIQRELSRLDTKK